HPVHAEGSLLGGPLLHVRVDPARERDHPVLHHDPDFVRLDACIPFQLGQHVVLNLLVVLPLRPSCCDCHVVLAATPTSLPRTSPPAAPESLRSLPGSPGASGASAGEPAS